MPTVLGGLAEFERELIRTRTGEGRERAKARGFILGGQRQHYPDMSLSLCRCSNRYAHDIVVW
jgi:DNA invertase Pin-like site-specific DNA recombinase